MSGVVIETFNCVRLPSGASFLVADVRQRCWTPQHKRYVGGAVVWLFLIPIGIPCAFCALLLYFRVPQIARVRVANAWLRCAVEYAHSAGIPQPPVDATTLGFDTISDEHLELLVSRLVLGEEEGDAKLAASGSADAEPQLDPPERKSSCMRRLHGTATPSVRLSSRRVILEKSLLLWCRTSGALTLPPLVWNEAEVDEVGGGKEEHEAAAATAKALRGAFWGWSATSLAATPSAQVSALEQRALRKVAFLFEAYKVNFWYWEIVELLRRLLLTSILALVRACLGRPCLR